MLQREVESKIKEHSSQLEQIDNLKATKYETQNIQTQVNNLVLGAVGSGNNAEVVQARGNNSVLNDRFLKLENGENINTSYVKTVVDIAYGEYETTHLLDENGNFKYVTNQLTRIDTLNNNYFLYCEVTLLSDEEHLEARIYQEGMGKYVDCESVSGFNGDIKTFFKKVDLSSLEYRIGLTFKPSNNTKGKQIKINRICLIPALTVDNDFALKTIKHYNSKTIPFLNICNKINESDISDNSISESKLNVGFIKKIDNIAYNLMINNYINQKITVNDVNGTTITNHITFDKSKKYYLVIKYSCDSCNCIFRVRSEGWGVSKTLELYSGYADKNVKIYELDMSNFDNDRFTVAIAKTNSEPQIIIHSIDVIEKNDLISSEVIKNIISKENEIKKQYTFYTLEENSKEEMPIITIGDSLINSGGSMADGIKKLTGYKNVIDYGNGGENCVTTIGRFGVFPYYVEPFTIPSSSSDSVNIVIRSSFNDYEINSVPNQLTDCYINGIKCNITNNEGAREVYKLNRVSDGEQVIIDRNTIIVTKEMLTYTDTFFPIISIGTNQGYDVSKLQDYIDMVNCFTKKCSNGKALILGFYTQGNTSIDKIIELENMLKRIYGNMFFSMREYFVKYGLKDCGLTATQTDLDYISQNKVPPQLLDDGVHYNSLAKEQLNKRICEKLEELGILKYRCI